MWRIKVTALQRLFILGDYSNDDTVRIAQFCFFFEPQPVDMVKGGKLPVGEYSVMHQNLEQKDIRWVDIDLDGREGNTGYATLTKLGDKYYEVECRFHAFDFNYYYGKFSFQIDTLKTIIQPGYTEWR